MTSRTTAHSSDYLHDAFYHAESRYLVQCTDKCTTDFSKKKKKEKKPHARLAALSRWTNTLSSNHQEREFPVDDGGTIKAAELCNAMPFGLRLTTLSLSHRRDG